MKISLALLMLSLVSFSPLAAQQESPPATATQIPAPVPDSDGVYEPGPGVVRPIFIERQPVALPDSDEPAATPRPCAVRVVIAADGTPQSIVVATSAGAAYDNALIDAIKHSSFDPGTVNGKPVPVRIVIDARFTNDGRPVYPKILTRSIPATRSVTAHNFDVPPQPLHTEIAQFSEEARKKRIEGIVVVSMLIGTDGIPTDLKVVRSIGYGLDEKALEAAAQYRFRPATKEGSPVPARISLEINFQLGSR